MRKQRVTVLKQGEERKTDDLKRRIKKLRADGKTYRDIAKQERISIAQISRILKEHGEDIPRESEARKIDGDAEEAARVFEMLEKGIPVTKIVINQKIAPDKANQLFQKWRELKLEELMPLGYLLLTKQEVREMMASSTNLSQTGENFLLHRNIFENPMRLLSTYPNRHPMGDYEYVAQILGIMQRVLERSKTAVLA